jgi:hypothetical protein
VRVPTQSGSIRIFWGKPLRPTIELPQALLRFLTLNMTRENRDVSSTHVTPTRLFQSAMMLRMVVRSVSLTLR